MSYILGKKLNMSQIWKDKKVIPVTVIEAAPVTVSIVRTKERDGYEAVQVRQGRHRRETRVAGKKEIGDTMDVSSFKEGDSVRVVGISKGKGFQGVVKRHGFAGGPQTHGQKNRQRAPGSIGSTAPQRVVPGRRMAGRMGGDRVTMKNLTVVKVDQEKNLLMIRGAIPGARGGLVEITKIGSAAEARSLRT